MKIHHLITSILIVSMIILGTTAYLDDLATGYSKTIDTSSLNRTQASMEKTRSDVLELSEQITDFELSYNPLDVFNIPYQFIQVAWGVTKTIFNSWETVSSMILDIGTGLNELGISLPEWLIPGLVSMLIITVVAILVYAFFKWKFED